MCATISCNDQAAMSGLMAESGCNNQLQQSAAMSQDCGQLDHEFHQHPAHEQEVVIRTTDLIGRQQQV